MELRLKKRIVGSFILLAAALIIIPLFFNHSVPSNALQLSDEIPTRPAKPGNLALPMPPKDAASASTRAANHKKDSDSSQSRIVFEQLQSLDSGNTTSQKPVAAVKTVAAPQPVPSVAAPESSAGRNAANGENVLQKTSAPDAPNIVATSPAPVSAPAEVTSSAGNIAKLEQQTMGSVAPVQKSASADSAPVTANEPVVSQPTATQKKSKTNNTNHASKAPSAIKTQNTAPSPESWAVQLGSFSGKLNAENLVKKLQAEGFSAYTRTSKTAHGDLIRVLVGPELRRADANNLLAKLQKQLNLQGMVVKGG